MINEERLKAGTRALTHYGALAAAAQSHARAMAESGVLSHQLPGGASLSSRVESANYLGWSALAENVAVATTSPEATLAAWLASPAHRSNLLDPLFTEAGVAHYFYSETGTYWVLILGRR